MSMKPEPDSDTQRTDHSDKIKPGKGTIREVDRAAIMAEAMEQLQRRGGISQEQRDDEIRDISKESAGQS